MTFLFVGGEDCNFTSSIGTVSTSTTAGRFRSTHARSAVSISGSLAATTTEGWIANFAASSVFWTSARMFMDQGGTAFGVGGSLITFLDGSVRRLWVVAYSTDVSTNGIKWRLNKVNAAGTVTTLQTSSVNIVLQSLTKVDVSVEYGVLGNVKVYASGTLVIDYSGDVTTDSATTLDGVNFGRYTSTNSGVGAAGYWSEIIVSTTDTRGMGLSTLVPSATGNALTWDSGSVSSINESTVDDTTMLYSLTANQIAEFTVTWLSSISSTTGVHAVAVTARAAKGISGPSKVDAMVRTASTDYVSSDLSLLTYFNPVQVIWDTNPSSSFAWSGGDIVDAGFNIGLKSIT